eukprot:NODE_554_length_6117_cov_0.778498.p3 type:complete len:185 gc:universal NODE_554_length_6117_cov_0.778498:3780-3226(-)
MLMKDLLATQEAELPKGYDLQDVVDIGIYKIKKQMGKSEGELKEALKQILKIKEELEVYRRYSTKYKKVMFFERKKTRKLYNRAIREEKSEEDILKAKADYIYTLQFPMDRKYISLLHVAEDNSKKIEIWQEIYERTKSGELDTEVCFKPFHTPPSLLRKNFKGMRMEAELVRKPEQDEFFEDA